MRDAVLMVCAGAATLVGWMVCRQLARATEACVRCVDRMAATLERVFAGREPEPSGRVPTPEFGEVTFVDDRQVVDWLDSLSGFPKDDEEI